MISNISAVSSMVQQTASTTSQSLTTEQNQVIEDTLAKYDAQSLSQEDALSIVEAFKDAGIEPGAALATAMSTQGFEASTVGDLAAQSDGARGAGGPPPPEAMVSSLDISDDQLEELNQLLSSYYDDEESSQEKSDLLASIQEILKNGAPEEGLVNLTA